MFIFTTNIIALYLPSNASPLSQQFTNVINYNLAPLVLYFQQPLLIHIPKLFSYCSKQHFGSYHNLHLHKFV